MPETFSISLNSEAETESLGFKIGELLQPGMVIGLCGTLGSGKTRLTQAIAKSLGIEEQVVSPTYTICVPYSGRLKLLHMDAYRIEHAEEVDELDLFERVEGGEVLIVEWADRVEQLLPDLDLVVSIVPEGESSRLVEIAGRTDIGAQFIAELSTKAD